MQRDGHKVSECAKLNSEEHGVPEASWQQSKKGICLRVPVSQPTPFLIDTYSIDPSQALEQECQSINYALYKCRKGMVDMRTRIRGNTGY